MKRVSVKLTYECGKCGNLVRRVYQSTPDGLLEIPTVYCGKCIGRKHFTVMSSTVSEEKCFEEADTSSAKTGLGGNDEVPEKLIPPTPPRRSPERREPANNAGKSDGSTGESGAQGVSGVPAE